MLYRDELNLSRKCISVKAPAGQNVSGESQTSTQEDTSSSTVKREASSSSSKCPQDAPGTVHRHSFRLQVRPTEMPTPQLLRLGALPADDDMTVSSSRPT